jgi:hypothetical protein
MYTLPINSHSPPMKQLCPSWHLKVVREEVVDGITVILYICSNAGMLTCYLAETGAPQGAPGRRELHGFSAGGERPVVLHLGARQRAGGEGRPEGSWTRSVKSHFVTVPAPPVARCFPRCFGRGAPVFTILQASGHPMRSYVYRIKRTPKKSGLRGARRLLWGWPAQLRR